MSEYKQCGSLIGASRVTNNAVERFLEEGCKIPRPDTASVGLGLKPGDQ